MFSFFSVVGDGDFPVWVSGEFDEDGEFTVSTVYPRNAASVNILDALTLEQIEGFAPAAHKALANANRQARADRAAEAHEERVAA